MSPQRTVEASLLSPAASTVRFVEMHTSGGIIRLTNAPQSISWNPMRTEAETAHVWDAFGGVVTIEDVRETPDIQGQRLRVTIGGVETAILARFLDNQLRGRAATVWLASVPAATGQVQGTPLVLFSGLASADWQFQHRTGDQPGFEISTNLLSRMAATEGARPLRMNVGSHEEWLRRGGQFASDRFFEFVPGLTGQVLQWGRLNSTYTSGTPGTVTPPPLPPSGPL